MTELQDNIIHANRKETPEEDLHRTEIGFYIMPQTRDVFITVINVCKLDISLANNVYCTCTYF
jgi:hypothetical protein